MNDIILVHGRNGARDSWFDLDRKLSKPDRRIKNVLLPDHDQSIFNSPCDFLKKLTEFTLPDLDHADSKMSMKDYIDGVSQHLPNDGTRATLIGHSLGGAVISNVASLYPDKVERLIYVAAMLPSNDETIAGIEARIRNFGLNMLEFWLAAFKAGSSIPLQLVRQPPLPLTAPFTRTDAFNATPKSYIHTTKDVVIPFEIQEEMVRNYPGIRTHIMKTGHLPQQSRPNQLLSIINSILGDDSKWVFNGHPSENDRSMSVG